MAQAMSDGHGILGETGRLEHPTISTPQLLQPSHLSWFDSQAMVHPVIFSDGEDTELRPFSPPVGFIVVALYVCWSRLLLISSTRYRRVG